MANRLTHQRIVTKADRIRQGGKLVPSRVIVPLCIPANAGLADASFFIADRAYGILSVKEVHGTLGTDGGAVSLDVKKCTGTQAPAAGVTVLASVFDLKATINTVVSKALSAVAADKKLAAGDRLALDFTGTLTAVAGLQVTVELEAL